MSSELYQSGIFEERHPGIALVHGLAVSCNFKGLHDAVGKALAQLAKREELTENQSSSAYEVFEICINKLEQTKNDAPWKGYEEQGRGYKSPFHLVKFYITYTFNEDLTNVAMFNDLFTDCS